MGDVRPPFNLASDNWAGSRKPSDSDNLVELVLPAVVRPAKRVVLCQR